MPRRHLLSVALNVLNPAAYQGWDGRLRGCHHDSVMLTSIAKEAGFTTERLWDAEATGEAVTARLVALAEEMKAGDLLVVGFSGHGIQEPDRDGDEEDGLDEGLCLYGGRVLDDTIAKAWSLFQPGVRVVALIDACHSDLGRAGPIAYVNPAVWTGERGEIAASVVTISGCQAHQTSGDSASGGLFTLALVQALAANPAATWRELHRETCKRLPRYQQPALDEIGPGGLADEPAFTPCGAR